MKELCIYTVICGGMDEIRQPLVVDDRFDYIFFSDSYEPGTCIGVWQVRAIPYSHVNLRVLSRFAKMMPGLVLPEYKVSLYIDGTLQIAKQSLYDKVIDLYHSSVLWAGIKHQYRDCIYDEMSSIVSDQWVHDYEVLPWYHKMKMVGFPSHYGMLENNVIFRQHVEIVQKVGEEWWRTMGKWVKRDQFSLMFCLWRNGIDYSYILPLNENVWKSESFVYNVHNPHKRVLDCGINELLRRKAWSASPWRNIRYGDMLNHICYLPCPRIAIEIWGFGMSLKYGYKVIERILKRKFVYRN